METRKFGRTGHMSTVAIFGAAAFGKFRKQMPTKSWNKSLKRASIILTSPPPMGKPKNASVPGCHANATVSSWGAKPWNAHNRAHGRKCKDRFKRLQTDTFDLYQCHAITTMEELDAVTMKGGALEAFVEARQRGLIKFIGITGHGVNAPQIYLEALRRFDFDSVLFPLNFVQMGNPEYRKYAEELIAECKAKDIGTMMIKSITKGPWGRRKHTATTWYEPFDTPSEIQRAVNFALSYEVTGLCTAGDTRVLPMMIEACENFTALNDHEKEEMIRSANQYEPLFV